MEQSIIVLGITPIYNIWIISKVSIFLNFIARNYNAFLNKYFCLFYCFHQIDLFSNISFVFIDSSVGSAFGL